MSITLGPEYGRSSPEGSIMSIIHFRCLSTLARCFFLPNLGVYPLQFLGVYLFHFLGVYRLSPRSTICLALVRSSGRAATSG